jgi:release factor glutamine methyltransferase
VDLSTLRTLFHTKLAALYPEREVEAIFFAYIYGKFGVEKYEFFLETGDGRQETEKEKRRKGEKENGEWEKDLEVLSNGFPLQYILGKTVFYGVEVEVSSAVLIPRPETEELVEVVVSGCRRLKSTDNNILINRGLQSTEIRLLDVGTGSGAIAIALAKNIKNAEVWATDISESALEIARKNAENHHVAIQFLHHDILKDDVAMLPDGLDVIVSNPPYIPNGEQINLHKNVVQYEPHEALFVPDENPLIFYDAIANVAIKNLREGGVLSFETHEEFHLELSAMLAQKGFKEISLWNDLNGKPRFASGKKL